jgi:hypothetical protein
MDDGKSLKDTSDLPAGVGWFDRRLDVPSDESLPLLRVKLDLD